MKKNYDVIALGELLIDFTENGVSAQGNPLMEANPGGAPCNVLAMLQKLGKRCAFVGKVGNDIFGHQLRAAGEEAGISMDYLMMDDLVHTTLAFVKTFPNGDRDFSFYRNPGADMMLRREELLLPGGIDQTQPVLPVGQSFRSSGTRRQHPPPAPAGPAAAAFRAPCERDCIRR